MFFCDYSYGCSCSVCAYSFVLLFYRLCRVPVCFVSFVGVLLRCIIYVCVCAFVITLIAVLVVCVFSCLAVLC